MEEFESTLTYETTRGTVVRTKLPRDFSNEELATLPGQNIMIDGRVYELLCVDSFTMLSGKWMKGDQVWLLIAGWNDAT
jgi:hypothetical protein